MAEGATGEASGAEGDDRPRENLTRNSESREEGMSPKKPPG